MVTLLYLYNMVTCNMVIYSIKSLPYFTQYGNPSNMVTFRPQCTPKNISIIPSIPIITIASYSNTSVIPIIFLRVINVPIVFNSFQLFE